MNLTKICVVILLALLTLPLFAQELEYRFQPGRNINLGAGYGLPYGGLGFGMDMYVFEKLAVNLGIGSLGHSAGFEAGLKYLLGDLHSQWRPEATLLYGVNGLLPADDDEVSQTEVYNGITAGLGVQAMFGKNRRHGLDAGATYVVSSGLYKRLEELEGYEFELNSRLGFYLGYRFAFELKY